MIHQDGKLLGHFDVKLEAGKKNVFMIPSQVSESGFHHFEVQLDAEGDLIPENNKGFAFTYGAGEPHVLAVPAAKVRWLRLMALVAGVVVLSAIAPYAEMRWWERISFTFAALAVAFELAPERRFVIAAVDVERAHEEGRPLAEREVDQERARGFVGGGRAALDRGHPERLDLDEVVRPPLEEGAGGERDVAVARPGVEGLRPAEVEEERLAVGPDPPRVLERAEAEREVLDGEFFTPLAA